MKRYLIVSGNPGKLVADPVSGLPKRWVGQKRMLWNDDCAGVRYADWFEPTTVAIEDHHDLRRAVKDGLLNLHRMVVAGTAQEALSASQPKPKRRKKSEPEMKNEETEE